VLVEAQLAAGDTAGARASYAVYRDAALRLLGAPPSAALSALVQTRPAQWRVTCRRGGPLCGPYRRRACARTGCSDHHRVPP
jgi:hypothetical protein